MNKQPIFLCACVFLFLQSFTPNLLAGNSERDRALQQVQEELTSLERRWYGLARFRWSYPQKLSAGFGAIIAQQPRDADCATSCMLHGWQFEVEPGMYGLQGSAGWGKLVGETGRTRNFMHTIYFAWAVRGAVLRTWGNSPLTPKAQTLVGVEGNLSLVRFNFSLGLMRSLSSNANRDWIITGGLGWGF